PLGAVRGRSGRRGGRAGGRFALPPAAAMPAPMGRLVLVNTTPRFLAAPGWPFGAPPALLQRLAARLNHGQAQAVDEFQKLQVRGNSPRTAARVLRGLRGALASHGAAQPAALAHRLARLRHPDPPPPPP